MKKEYHFFTAVSTTNGLSLVIRKDQAEGKCVLQEDASPLEQGIYIAKSAERRRKANHQKEKACREEKNS
jgi:hypothetical protein